MKLDGTVCRPVPWSKDYIGQGFGTAEQPYRWQAYQNHLLWQEHLQRFFPHHMKHRGFEERLRDAWQEFWR